MTKNNHVLEEKYYLKEGFHGLVVYLKKLMINCLVMVGLFTAVNMHYKSPKGQQTMYCFLHLS